MKTNRKTLLGAAAGTRRARCFRPKMKNAEKLLKIVGMEKFLTLRDEFGGRSLWIPKRGRIMPCGVCGARDRCIYRWHQQGHTPAVISAALKMSSKTVVRILRAGHAGARSA